MGSKNIAWILVIVLTILLFISGGVIISLLGENKNPAKPQISEVNFVQPSPIPSPAFVTKDISLNKRFNFPILDGAGNKAGEIAFTLIKAQRTREIEIAGQTATALPGRVLILIDVELTNDGNLEATMQARNYLRLTVNGETKLAAPDYRSDPVDMQPKSTKDIRMGFNVADTDEQLVLQAGELEGKKELIPLNF
jgi:hypothetical protein